jgi:alkylhydroperoxidase family enzyme
MELCKFAEKLTINPKKIKKNDIESLKTFDFNEIEISEIVQVISYFNYINRVADGLGLEPEDFIDNLGYKKNIDE